MTSKLIFLKFDFVITNLKQNLATLAHHITSGYQNRRLKGAGGGEHQMLGNFLRFVTKIMYFRHILAKIQPKNLKHFDWGGGASPSAAPKCQGAFHVFVTPKINLASLFL